MWADLNGKKLAMLNNVWNFMKSLVADFYQPKAVSGESFNLVGRLILWL